MREANQVAIEAVRRVLEGSLDVAWAYVFGSVARGVPFRDVDVAIMPSPSMPRGAVAFGVLIADLESATGNRIDLVDLSVAEIPLVGPMLTERVVVCCRDEVGRRTWEAERTSMWLDFQPAWRAAERTRRAALRRRIGRSEP